MYTVTVLIFDVGKKKIGNAEKRKGRNPMTNKLTDEQRKLVQTSIDFLKRDVWNKYTDAEDIKTLVIGNVNYIESYIQKLISSEQAWKEEAADTDRALLETLDRVHDLEGDINKVKFQLNEALQKAAQNGDCCLSWNEEVERLEKENKFLRAQIESLEGRLAHYKGYEG
jgi:chromosome segregation ATPase